MAEDSPVYNYCFTGRCLAPEADRPNGCPNCPVTQAFELLQERYHKILRREVVRAIQEAGESVAPEDLERHLKRGVQFSEALEILGTCIELERTVAEDINNPRWNVRTAAIISILRQERAAVRREYRGKARAEREALARSRRVNSGYQMGEGE